MSGKAWPLEGRFWERTIKTESGCWEWQGWQAGKGYGMINHLGKKVYAHRLSWTLYWGSIPDKLHVLHRCDNPLCINPRHLFLGTNLDNIKDRIAKGRSPHPDVQGEKNPRAILTEKDVIRIRTLYHRGWKHEQIADIFCAPIVAVRKAALRQSWKHLP